jgi:hypothetical protein
MSEDIEVFTTKPVSELDLSKLFEEEFNKELRSLLERIISIVTGYATGIANWASRWFELNVLVVYSYSFEPDGVKFEIKYFLDPKSIEKLKKRVMEKVEKKWIRIKLAEKHLQKQK